MRNRQLLDGLWQFLPLAEPLPAPPATPPPTQGFAATPIRVPGYWNTFPPAVGGDWDAYHHYHYPTAWQAAPAAWLGTTFQPAECPEPDKARTWLRFDAVAGHAFIWVNGQWLGDNRDSFLPFEFDVSTLLRPGNNTLAVYVAPPPQREGLWLQPCGSWVGWYMRGIWQSVALVRVPRPAVCDVFVQPSVRQGTLIVSVTANCDAHPTAVHVRIRDGEKSVLTLGPANLPAGTEPATLTLSTPWPNARYWCPDDPHLYHADAELRRGNEVIDTHTVRFGFREFWIDGTEFRLNGERLRLFGDSWHYMGVAQQNPAYARTWFRFCKEIGANAIRTHAMPYPPCYYDTADELGMLIIDETAVYGSAGTLAFGEADFWEQSRAHLRRLVLRDRNHPAVIFWSACNETVWKGGAAIFPGLLSLAETARALDPTRLVSFDENDCDVGGAAVLHAGHYGTPQHWERVWRRDRPLVLHEFSALLPRRARSRLSIRKRDRLRRLRRTPASHRRRRGRDVSTTAPPGRGQHHAVEPQLVWPAPRSRGTGRGTRPRVAGRRSAIRADRFLRPHIELRLPSRRPGLGTQRSARGPCTLLSPSALLRAAPATAGLRGRRGAT
ncbi:MAG: hypothetical protein IPM18_17785 [Phycisphaerales bacterium]|nr:hypothetical protein [Phycisphaerales bacterium]